jgi:GIY-YIG catalytic domain
MSSGIYKMTFSDGSIYIGKSADVAKRWAQHSKAFSKGTHTKKLQEAYDSMGSPNYEIIFECHPDHIDILESYFINKYWNDNILNTTCPADLEDQDLKLLSEVNPSVWSLSTFDHLFNWLDIQKDRDNLKNTLNNSKRASTVKELEKKLLEANQEIVRLKSRGFFSRLFNL